jgi:predicted nucleotidyltransferase component of viral defense system
VEPGAAIVNREDLKKWKNELLDHMLAAFAAHKPLTEVLCFKGARILNLRLGTEIRQSLDIDSNLESRFVLSCKDPNRQCDYLVKECNVAIEAYFSYQSPVRYRLLKVTGSLQPSDGHPFGWDGRTVRITVSDRKFPTTRGLPPVELEIASPEKLSPHSSAVLQIGEHAVNAYTLERIAGEKMRAFLSSLPAYKEKIRRSAGQRRVKDLYDINRIYSKFPISEENFWQEAGNEFILACESRFVDCSGIGSFEQGLEETRSMYVHDPTIPKDVQFEQAWHSLADIVDFIEKRGILPFVFPIRQDIQASNH